MGRAAWDTIKRGRYFHVVLYRRMGTLLYISLLLNVALTGGVYYYYLDQPARRYFATSGVAPPIELQSRAEPNHSSTALLESTPPAAPRNQLTIR